jgi:hypothetical protein
LFRADQKSTTSLNFGSRVIIFDLLSSDLKIGTAYANFVFIGQNPSLLGKTQVAGDLGWVARFFFKRPRFLVFISLVI